jgi:hypothetical protein
MITYQVKGIAPQFNFMEQDASPSCISSKTATIRTMLRNAWITGGLAIGLKEVWREANKHRGWLLIDANICNDKDPDFICTTTNAAVEDIIQQVLESGGAVELVDGGILKEYGHIVLIRY